jgi:hypothetical protein
MVLNTGLYAEEISWKLNFVADGHTWCDSGDNLYTNNDKFEITCCVPGGKYKLLCIDSYGVRVFLG